MDADDAETGRAVSMGDRERERLRREQAERVMPLIGPLLDAWDGMPNDEKDPDSPLYALMVQIDRAMEGD